ncbi:hypothetical protein CONPUDRAFT_170312 [Coniophora puteana RWD-64-598 SS2]|uniref:Uncharacterized protein n=1 Tax=Coniophora puteana (strain RWD-64-598) TaxID=741705 RepID=R7SD92_CONPW|nr:uncharacterized protein CONPUDRAFT_170312 [Coniophora puteana RWD-64-598 SS2]EIW74133.1 hypothetical protein CONPUDRAFT_170312 [Coniophora puteana RWD-64-598 SS2]
MVFLIAKAHFAQSPDILLNAICLYPFMGDPSGDSYLAFMPEAYKCPFFFGDGRVSTSSLNDLPDPTSTLRVFDVCVTEFVRHAPVSSTVQFSFESTHPRWVNARAPNANTCVAILGQACDLSTCGFIQFAMQSIALNTAAPQSVGGTRSQPGAPGGGTGSSPSTPFVSPSKRKRFTPHPSSSTRQRTSGLSYNTEEEFQAQGEAVFPAVASGVSASTAVPLNGYPAPHLSPLPAATFHPQTPRPLHPSCPSRSLLVVVFIHVVARSFGRFVFVPLFIVYFVRIEYSIHDRSIHTRCYSVCARAL